MAIILCFVARLVMVSFIPEVVVFVMMVLAVLLRVHSAVVTRESIAVVLTRLTVVMGTATLVVTGAGHSRGQSREHNGKNEYLHPATPPSFSENPKSR